MSLQLGTKPSTGRAQQYDFDLNYDAPGLKKGEHLFIAGFEAVCQSNLFKLDQTRFYGTFKLRNNLRISGQRDQISQSFVRCRSREQNGRGGEVCYCLTVSRVFQKILDFETLSQRKKKSK